jgi:hypothetical protein
VLRGLLLDFLQRGGPLAMLRRMVGIPPVFTRGGAFS